MNVEEKSWPDIDGKHDYVYVIADCGLRFVRYRAENPTREELFIDTDSTDYLDITKDDIPDIEACIAKLKELTQS